MSHFANFYVEMHKIQFSFNSNNWESANWNFNWCWTYH